MTDAIKSRDRILSRAYRAGAREEPPARLDAAILAKARQALGASSRAHGPFGSHWIVPLSAAAVAVLSIGLLVFMDREGGVPWRTEAPGTPATKSEAVTSAKTPVADAGRQKEVAKVGIPETIATGAAPAASAVRTEPVEAPSTSGAAPTPSLAARSEKSATTAAAESEMALERADWAARRKDDATAAASSARNAESASSPSAPTIELRVGDRVIRAEIASTPEERQRGLMFRERLAADAGMLFVFSSDQGAACLWMKNTTVALSAAFLDSAGGVLNIVDMQPHSEKVHCATGRARFVLEVNRGVFSAAGVKPGTRIGGLPGIP